MTKSKKLSFDPEKIYFIPLGGSEQFGVNLNLYAHQNEFLMIDCGIGFADHRYPGIDIFLPDPGFIAERKKQLSGLIITHAHEDHIGAVAYLWPRLRCPIYCSAFTAVVLRKKFEEHPDCKGAEIHVIDTEQTQEIGAFRTKFISVAHSIPDSVSVILETKYGTIVHSGDWNLDPNPVLGTKTDEKAFRALKNVIAYVGDSTNANVNGVSGSEGDVEKGLEQVFKSCKKRVAVTIFSSNIGRMRSVLKAASACDRSVALIGRSLHTMAGSAKQCGFLDGVPDFVSEEDLGYLPEEKQVMIVTGSQGEGRAALAKIARGDHPQISLGKGDTVIFSSRAIPGNEGDINHVKNNLVGSGVSVISPRDTEHCIHVSGHPCRDEITQMFQWLKPKSVIPVHGERVQLEAHAELAKNCQVENVVIPVNGSVVCIEKNKSEIVDHVETGLIAVDQRRLIKADHKSIVARRKIQYSGTVHLSVVLDDRGDLVCDPQLSSEGLLDHEIEEDLELEDDILAEISDILLDIKRKDRLNNDFVQEELRIGVRRYVWNMLGIKPKTSVHVIRI